MKRLLKFVAVFLSAMIITQTFTTVTMAAEETPGQQTISDYNWGEPGFPETSTDSDAQIISEVTDKRTECSKTFAMNDGTFMVASYNEPIHYEDSNGTWQDIDNTLSSTADASTANNSSITKDSLANSLNVVTAQTLENKAGKNKIKFSKIMKSGSTISVNAGKYAISWGVDNTNTSSAQIVADTVKTDSKDYNDAFLNLKKLHSEIIYKNAFSGIDVEYTLSSSSVKENLIINNKEAQKQFTETYKIGDLIAKQKDSKTIELIAKSDTKQKNVIYTITAPQMTDANGVISDKVTINIIQQNKGSLQIGIKTDKSWMDDSKRTYPVTVDPDVSTQRSTTNDTFISEGNPNDIENQKNPGNMYVGYDSNYKTSRVLVKFNLPGLSKGDMIVQSQLNITQHSTGMSPSTASMQVNAYEMKSAWDENTATWNNMKAVTDTAKSGALIDYCNTSQSLNNKCNSWDVTKLVKKWYNGTSVNNGVALISNDESAVARNQYVASEAQDADGIYPGLVINYVSNIGLEDYWSYHSQSVGRAGTGYINDYTGNLVFSTPILQTSGSKSPLNFNITYNGYQSGAHFQNGVVYGYGWQSNLSQRIDPFASNTYKYVYTDEDGTRHYFTVDPSNSSQYIDEDGLGLELTTGGTSDDYYTLTSSDGTKKTYTGSGYLHKITDTNSNTITLKYMGAFLSEIADGSGRKYKVSYLQIPGTQYYSITSIAREDDNDNNVLHEPINFRYTDNNLTSVIFADGKTVSFSYDNENRLIKATNTDNSNIQYGYAAGSDLMVKNRVSGVTEYSATGESGNKIAATYNPDNTTTFQYTSSGSTQKETDSFDNAGKTICVVNADNSASLSSYNQGTSDTKNKNKMTSQASTSAPVINFLKDHDAELNNGNWNGSNWASPGGSFSVDSSAAYLGKNSFKISQQQANPQRSGAEQIFTNLTPGAIYTMSGYVRTNSVSSGLGADLYVATFNGSTQLSTVNGKGVFGTNDVWQKLSVTFTVPSNATKVSVYCGLSYANGTAWFDSLQLEAGDVANNYNLLENSDFRYSASYQPLSWTSSNITSGDGMSGGWLRIGGNTTLEKSYFQAVNINKSAANISFAVSGKAQGKSIPTHKGGRYFAIDLGIAYTDGTVDWNIVGFNPDSSGEQYTSGLITPASTTKTISSIGYYILYYKNGNEALFKDMQLNINNSQVNSAYKNGNLTSTNQNGQGGTTYDYTSANEVSTSSSDDGTTSSNTYYQNGHQLKSSRDDKTQYGSNYSYDASGNVTTTKTGKILDTGEIDSLSPYYQTSTNYDASGNYATSETDQRGKTTSYKVDSATGVTQEVTDPNQNTTKYSYNNSDESNPVYYSQNNLLTKTQIDLGDNKTIANSYGYDAADNLNKITHNGFDYTFIRDGFGNTTGINVGSQNLITNSYASGNGNLLTSTYGNGFKLGYGYDAYNRVTSVAKNGTTAYQYFYDANGNLAKSIDKTSGTDVTSIFSYDINNRLIQKAFGDGSSINYSFDSLGRSNGSAYSFAGQTKTASLSYGTDGQTDTVNLLSGGKVTYKNDTLNRTYLTSIDPATGSGAVLKAQKDYVGTPDTNKTSPLITSYTNIRSQGDANMTLSRYQYGYDDNGNIVSVQDQDGYTTKYAYDKLNELIRVDDQKANVSTTYSYDLGGNIAGTKTYAYTTEALGDVNASVDYAYGNGNWKDLLTSYNGQAITYDAIGNPLSYRDGMNFTWEGRQLKTAVANGKNLSYTYDDDGIRTNKTVDGVTTNYFLDGSTIIAQQTGNDVLWFLYDSDGTRVGFTYNGTAYYYTTNAQGDVTGITDSNCNTIVEYSYDAWGKLLSTTGSMADTIGKINPFLYRGYYFDSDAGLYYLNSRYYDAQTGRFLNADAQIDDGAGILGTNLFQYSANNPIINSDPTGKSVASMILNIASTVITALFWIFPAFSWFKLGWALGVGLASIAITVYDYNQSISRVNARYRQHKINRVNYNYEIATDNFWLKVGIAAGVITTLFTLLGHPRFSRFMDRTGMVILNTLVSVFLGHTLSNAMWISDLVTIINGDVRWY